MSISRRRGRRQNLRQTKVEYFDNVPGGHLYQEDVLRFEIAMEQLPLMRFFDGGAYSVQNLERTFRRNAFGRVEFRSQRPASEKFHDDERLAALHAKIVNGDDVGMDDSCSRPGFAMEPRR